jgi:hypothetical protein
MLHLSVQQEKLLGCAGRALAQRCWRGRRSDETLASTWWQWLWRLKRVAQRKYLLSVQIVKNWSD